MDSFPRRDLADVCPTVALIQIRKVQVGIGLDHAGQTETQKKGRPLEDSMELPSALYALVRFGHIASAIVWLGLIFFMAFVRPRMFAGLSEDTRRQVLPHLAKNVMPAMGISATLTIAFGVVLHVELGSRIGFDNIGMGLNLAILFAFIMYGLGLGLVMPVARKTAKVLQGGKPPSAQEVRRMGMITHAMVGLGLVVLFLMVASPRISWL